MSVRNERTGGEEANRRTLDEAIADEFARFSDQQLIRRMERKPDFGCDDEEHELNRRLKLGGLAWRWSSDFYNPKVEVYSPETAPHQTDDDRINQGIADWRERCEGTITDTTARVIASQHHGGQSSALYSFSSTGRIDIDGMSAELMQSAREYEEDTEVTTHLEALASYVLHHGEREAVEGWHQTTSWGQA